MLGSNPESTVIVGPGIRNPLLRTVLDTLDTLVGATFV